MRDAFFAAALRQDFRFATVYVNKVRTDGKPRRTAECYAATATALSDLMGPLYTAARDANPARLSTEAVYIDDNQDNTFLQAIKAAFRRSCQSDVPKRALVGKVKFRKSHTDELLQLADMVCGAVASHLDGDGRWYGQIRKREVGVPQSVALRDENNGGRR